MYVCICNAVTEREVRHAVQLGADNLNDLKEGLGVAACCGKCASCAKGIIREEQKQMREMKEQMREMHSIGISAAL